MCDLYLQHLCNTHFSYKCVTFNLCSAHSTTSAGIGSTVWGNSTVSCCHQISNGILQESKIVSLEKYCIHISLLIVVQHHKRYVSLHACICTYT